MRTILSILLLLLSPTFALAQVQIMDAGKLARIKALLPEVNDEAFAKILADPSTIWYTRTEMPAIYQRGGAVDTSQSPMGFSLANVNISGDPPDNGFRNGIGGNGNVEASFPWSQHPGGGHLAPTVSDAKFMWLPKQANGQPWPVVYWQEVVPGFFPAQGQRMLGWNWDFPIGTVFGEVIFQRGPTNDDFVFEIRMRERKPSFWEVESFVPFPNSEDMAERIVTLRPDWESNNALTSMVRFLVEEKPVQVAQLKDKNRTETAFDVTAGVEYLPSLGDDRLLAELLVTTKFESRIGEAWRVGTNGQEVLVPSTEAEWQIVPKGWRGGFVGNDASGCVNCHNSTGGRNSVRRFDRNRGWYGSIRGNNGTDSLPGIFSFNWVDPQAVRGGGLVRNPPPRPAFVQAGVVERYARAKHPAAIYPFGQ